MSKDEEVKVGVSLLLESREDVIRLRDLLVALREENDVKGKTLEPPLQESSERVTYIGTIPEERRCCTFCASDLKIGGNWKELRATKREHTCNSCHSKSNNTEGSRTEVSERYCYGCGDALLAEDNWARGNLGSRIWKEHICNLCIETRNELWYERRRCRECEVMLKCDKGNEGHNWWPSAHDHRNAVCIPCAKARQRRSYAARQRRKREANEG